MLRFRCIPWLRFVLHLANNGATFRPTVEGLLPKGFFSWENFFLGKEDFEENGSPLAWIVF